MKKNDGSKDKSSNIVLKIGITYIIPIFLAICGALIIFTDLWKQTFRRFYFYENYENTEKTPNEINSLEVNGKRIFVPSAAENFATIKIPAINLDEDIYEGSYNEIMTLGIGHYPFSGLPGFNRNCILKGLNNSEFDNINKLQNGDEVIIETDYGEYSYKVSEINVYKKDDESFMECYGGKEKLTLYTDYPFDDSSANTGQKYVVICEHVK